MKKQSLPTRRSFFQASAVLAAPLAITGAAAVNSGNDAVALEARVALLEAVNTIRELQLVYAKRLSAGTQAGLNALLTEPSTVPVGTRVSGLTADSFTPPDISVAADGRTAMARMHCTVEIETDIGPNCTLVEMARLQGEGVLHQSERRVLESAYVKYGNTWKIERSILSEV